MQNAVAGVRGVSEGKARGQVFVIPGPVGLLPVRLSGKGFRHYAAILRVISLALPHSGRALVKPAIEADTGRQLIAVDLIRGLQQRIAEPARQNQVGGKAPTVLEVHLTFCALKITGNQLAWSKEVPGFILVVDRIALGKQTGNGRSRKVVGLAKTGIDGWIPARCRVQGCTRVSDARRRKPERIGHSSWNILCGAGAVVGNDP